MTEALAEGIAAWDRLKGRERATWDDWLAVGRALVIGRAEAMKAAKTNKPMGSRYNKLFGAWLRENGIADITAQERYRILLIIDNIDIISKWRVDLDPATRRRLNHPGAVWSHWRKSQDPRKPSEPRRRPVMSDKPGPKARPVYWPQDAVRRAATAMRESYSQDFYALARVALEAAIRDEIDLLELLSSPKPTPVKPMPAMALAL